MRRRSKLFQRVSLSGQLCPDSANFSKRIQSKSGRYLLGARPRWTPFDFGTTGLRIAASKGWARNSLAGYDSLPPVRPKMPRAPSVAKPAAPSAC